MVAAAKAVLFDIDGTILRAIGAGREALARAVSAVLARPIEQARSALAAIDFRGATDVMIVEQLGIALGIPLGLETPRLTDRYVRELDIVLDEVAVEIMPGIHELLAALQARPRTTVGLLTGNVRAAARAKLRRLGLERLVDAPGGFAEDGRQRHEVAAVAMERLAAVGVHSWATLVVGDTEHDVAAAHYNGSPAVAVATGWTPLAELRHCDAQLVLPDLGDPSPLLRLLDAL